MSNKDNQNPIELDDLLESLPAKATAPDAFETLWGELQQPAVATPPSAPTLRSRWPFAAFAACAATLLVVWWSPVLPGEGTAALHEQVAIGRDGMAMVHAGEGIKYHTAVGGSTVVSQNDGTVFYRAPKGKDFSVETPLATIQSTGTSFSVEVIPMQSTVALSRTIKQNAAVALASAVIGAGLSIAVYEGSVSITDKNEQVVDVPAGTRAHISEKNGTTVAPVYVTPTSKKSNAMPASTPAEMQDRLAKQELTCESDKAELKETIAALESNIKEYDEEQAALTGKPFEFPEDIDSKYLEDNMKKFFESKIAESGLKGTLENIDCSEFPCIVYGSKEHPGKGRAGLDDAFRKLQELLREGFPTEENDFTSSVWGGGENENGEAMPDDFAYAIYPKDTVDKEDKSSFGKRIKFRKETYMDAKREGRND